VPGVGFNPVNQGPPKSRKRPQTRDVNTADLFWAHFETIELVTKLKAETRPVVVGTEKKSDADAVSTSRFDTNGVNKTVSFISI